MPSEWSVVPLGHVGATQYGLSATASVDGTVPMLGMKDISDGTLHFTNVPRIKLTDGELAIYRLNGGDILFNRTNSADLVGKTALFPGGRAEPYVFASYLVRVTTRRDEANPQFVCYYMNSRAGICRLRALATPGVSQYNISPGNLQRHFLVPLPSLHEQEKIVAILSTWDKAIAQAKKLIEAKRELKKG